MAVLLSLGTAGRCQPGPVSAKSLVRSGMAMVEPAALSCLFYVGFGEVGFHGLVISVRVGNLGETNMNQSP